MTDSNAQPATVAEVLEAVVDRGLTTPAGMQQHLRKFSVVDSDDLSTLVAADWWHLYSRRHGRRHIRAAYLGGTDGDGSWAVRVPAPADLTAPTLDDAWRFCWGSQQVNAMRRLPWRRQGDLLFTCRLLCRTADAAIQADDLQNQIDEQVAHSWATHDRPPNHRHSVRVHAGGGLIASHAGGHHAVRMPLTISAAEAHAEIQSLECSGRSRLPRATRGRYGLTWRATIARQDAGSGGRGCGD